MICFVGFCKKNDSSEFQKSQDTRFWPYNQNKLRMLKRETEFAKSVPNLVQNR